MPARSSCACVVPARESVEVYTSKFGTVSAEGRREGATVFDRQDRTDGITNTYTDVSSLVLPAHMQFGVQVIFFSSLF